MSCGKEAWRKHHGYSKSALDNLVCITVPINFAREKSIDKALADLTTQNFRPDFIVIDTWFKSTAGANVSDQAEMTEAIERLTVFQKALEAVADLKDAQPRVTILILAHTDKKGLELFGSIAQFASCDVLYKLTREERAPAVTISCTGARDIEEPPALIIGLEEVIIETAKGAEKNLAVTKAISGYEAVLNKKPGDIGTELGRDLDDMIATLAHDLGGGATFTDWWHQMQVKYPQGAWSKTTFRRKLNMLKEQDRVIAGGGKGEFYRLPDQVVPQGSEPPSSDQDHRGQPSSPLGGDDGLAPIMSVKSGPNRSRGPNASKSGNGQNLVEQTDEPMAAAADDVDNVLDAGAKSALGKKG